MPTATSARPPASPPRSSVPVCEDKKGETLFFLALHVELGRWAVVVEDVDAGSFGGSGLGIDLQPFPGLHLDDGHLVVLQLVKEVAQRQQVTVDNRPVVHGDDAAFRLDL